MILIKNSLSLFLREGEGVELNNELHEQSHNSSFEVIWKYSAKKIHNSYGRNTVIKDFTGYRGSLKVDSPYHAILKSWEMGQISSLRDQYATREDRLIFITARGKVI